MKRPGDRSVLYAPSACSAADTEIDKVEELLHPSDFERTVDPIVHADQVQTVPVLLVGDISAYQRPNPSGINVRNVAEVEQQRARIIGTDSGLEIKQCGHGQRPGQAQNALPFLWPRDIFYDERVLRHREIIVCDSFGSC